MFWAELKRQFTFRSILSTLCFGFGLVVIMSFGDMGVIIYLLAACAVFVLVPDASVIIGRPLK